MEVMGSAAFEERGDEDSDKLGEGARVLVDDNDDRRENGDAEDEREAIGE